MKSLAMILKLAVIRSLRVVGSDFEAVGMRILRVLAAYDFVAVWVEIVAGFGVGLLLVLAAESAAFGCRRFCRHRWRRRFADSGLKLQASGVVVVAAAVVVVVGGGGGRGGGVVAAATFGCCCCWCCCSC